MLQSVEGATRSDGVSSAVEGLTGVVVNEGLARGCYLWHMMSKVSFVSADFFSVSFLAFLAIFFRSSPITFV
ncbi:hypothetical protein ACOSP7_028586 [Xanthoceras sorbifolium]